jgi:hypothetical protein
MRRITALTATAAIGAMSGFLIPTIIADFTPEPTVQARVAESPVARQFIRAYVADDQGSLDSLGVAADVKLRATSFRADFVEVGEPVHLGSFIGGGFSLHAYAAPATRADGTEDLLGFRVATAGGQVFIIDPPQVSAQP